VKTSFPIAALFCFQLATFAQAAQTQFVQGHVPDVVTRLQPAGRPAATEVLQLVIGLPLRHRDALTNLLQRLYDPASPDYHHYLTPAQFTERFGPTEADYQAVIHFAKAHGLEVSATHSSRKLLDVQGKVSDVEKAFHVTLHTYQHPTEARQFYAPDVEPSVDAGLSILDINGLSDYALLRPMVHRKQTANKNGTGSGSAPDGVSFLGSDFRNAYAPGVTLTGAGQTVGLFEADGYYVRDITNYETLAGLPHVPLQNIEVAGFNGTPGVNNAEVALDIEMAIAMAPGLSAVVVYETTNKVSDWIDILDSMTTNVQIQQFSSSWGYAGTPDPNTSFDAIFQTMAAQGQSFFQAAGDGDAWTSQIWVPADSPYVTSVGGTSLTMSGSGAAYVSETVWNSGFLGSNDYWSYNGESGWWGSGGGVSAVYSIPSWQQGLNMSLNHGSTNMRNIPDVALVADDIWAAYNNGASESFMGTSCAAPLWAGFIALANEQTVSNGLPPVGFINPAIYALGQGTNYTTCFNDITTGNDTWTGSPTNYFAVSGYDLCTGWGTPGGGNLIGALAPAETPSGSSLVQNGGFELGSFADWTTSGNFSPTTCSVVSDSQYVHSGMYGAQLGPGQSTLAYISQTFATTIGQLYLVSCWLYSDGLTPDEFSVSWNGNTLYNQTNIPGTGWINLEFKVPALVTNTDLAFGFYDNPSFLGLDDITVTPIISEAPLSPSVTRQPANQTVAAGGSATFYVTASGTAPLNYSWRRNNVPIAGATKYSYTTNNVLLADSGIQISCLVSNAASSLASSNATLTVFPAPQFQTTTVASGTVSFSWNVESGQLYQVQYTTNLAQSPWTNLGGVLSATNSTTLSTNDTTTSMERFYRVVLLPP
jgi:hypothetical protein